MLQNARRDQSAMLEAENALCDESFFRCNDKERQRAPDRGSGSANVSDVIGVIPVIIPHANTILVKGPSKNKATRQPQTNSQHMFSQKIV
eukprot:1520634-Rhodomonas_salina.2